MLYKTENRVLIVEEVPPSEAEAKVVRRSMVVFCVGLTGRSFPSLMQRKDPLGWMQRWQPLEQIGDTVHIAVPFQYQQLDQLAFRDW